jgi:hypothetical protein
VVTARFFLVLLVASLVLPAAAQAHGTESHELTAGQRHAAADLADVPVQTLERRMRAITKRLGRQPGTRTASASGKLRLRGSLDPGTVGRWSEVIPAPVVPVFEALLPSGRILMWDSVGDNAAESYPDHTFTRAAVYDPVTNTSKRVDVAGSNIFCAGFVQLANGNVFVAGGNLDSALHGIRETHTFDWKTETWSRGPDMQDGRWYPSVASMPNDEALIIGGGPTTAEIRTTAGSLRRAQGIVTPASREYPFFQSAPDGRALLMGPMQTLSMIDTAGAGAITAFGARDAINRTYGSYAPYDIGKYLVAGGGAVAEDNLSGVPTRTAVTINTRSGTPVASATGALTNRRRQHNLTVLADGSVLATGGQSTNGGGGNVDLANAVYNAERWNPATGQWAVLAPATVAREYHSTAILLPDGRVLTGGGGICGPCDTVGYLRRDFEIFTPPYLYRQDGSGGLATRPTTSGVPASTTYKTAFTMSSPQAASIRKVGLVRLGAPTHGQDQSQRYVPLQYTVSGTTLTVKTPNNPNEAPAGPYMLFAVDAAGAPSMSKILTVARTTVAAPATPNLAVNRPVTGSTPCATTEGPEKAVDGTTAGGRSGKFCTNVEGLRYLEVDLGVDRTVSSFISKFSGEGGEPPMYNVRGYRVETRTSTGSYSTAATVTDNASNVSTVTATPRVARYVRIVFTAGEQANPDGAARIFEFEIYPGLPPGRVTTPLIAFSNQSFGGRVQRFEAGAYEASRGNLGQVGADAIRSVVVAAGYRATLCRDAGLADCTTLNAGSYATLNTRTDRAVSSLAVTKAP